MKNSSWLCNISRCSFAFSTLRAAGFPRRTRSLHLHSAYTVVIPLVSCGGFTLTMPSSIALRHGFLSGIYRSHIKTSALHLASGTARGAFERSLCTFFMCKEYRTLFRTATMGGGIVNNPHLPPGERAQALACARGQVAAVQPPRRLSKIIAHLDVQ
jgi:hypothetical protein